MYPLPTKPSPSTSTSVPRPTSTFEPNSPKPLTNSTENHNTESSPQSSLPCGQRTPTNTSDTPSQHTPPQPFVHYQPRPNIPTQTHHTSPKPHKLQHMQHSPVKTNVNLPTQPSISDEEQQRVPKSTNGSQVKCSKPQLRQQDGCLCFYCNQPGHLKSERSHNLDRSFRNSYIIPSLPTREQHARSVQNARSRFNKLNQSYSC